MTDSNDAAQAWCAFAPIVARTISKDLLRRCQGVLGEHGLAKMHMIFIATLAADGATLKDLSNSLCVDKAHTTRAIAFLTERGFVYDDRDNEKSRKYKVFLTVKGRTLAADLKKVIDDAFVDYTDGIPEEDILTVMSVMEKMRSNIDSEEKLDDNSRGCGF
ncbi:MAG: MarR family winged helix-turn-helix transcriptional regulator [Candidatus Methanoplasma sp.]|jgi:DNA-binding MarR family transcriptional regulator|nr:MarR family winged helix-turn-helix transcriptional regulator [Candidatus Methanoplasma sp.]